MAESAVVAETFGEAAKAYAERGWRVLPLHSPDPDHPSGCSCRRDGCASPAKHPRTRHGKDDATTDLKQIRKWWWMWPEANVGIATTDGLAVLDVDPRHGGADSLRELEEAHEELVTLTVRTGGSGLHLYLKGDLPARNGFRPGLDLKAEGGYVVAPPSVHASGRRYAWLTPGEEPRAAPDWLRELLEPRPTSNGSAPPAGGGLPDDVHGLLAAIPSSVDREEWIRVGMALHHADPDRGLSLWDTWSAGCEEKYPGAAEILRQWQSFEEDRPEVVTIGTLRHLAQARGYDPPPRDPPRRNGTRPQTEQAGDDELDCVELEDFYAYLPEHRYIFVPSRDLWPASSVNARLERTQDEDTEKVVKASTYLDRHRAVEQMTWAPGEGLIVEDRLVSHGGWLDVPGCRVFNLYRSPQVAPGDPEKATPWLEHLRRVWPTSAGHLVAYFAHRVQRPGEKINHALVLGGLQGIGKDTALEPVKHAVGPWNFVEVAPSHLLGRFNGFVKSVVLRVSEARDLGDVDRYSFYEHLKAYTASPPDVLRCDEKNVREYSVLNVCSVVITTNHKTDGFYLPADDRRHFVAWSELTKNDFDDAYWRELWSWYEGGGLEHVAAYLTNFDLSDFDPKRPPPKTDAFWDIVDANRAPEDAELADALDRLMNPAAVTLDELTNAAEDTFVAWLNDRKNRRQIPHRMESAGYVPVRNDSAKSGLWVVGGKRQVVYGRRELSVRDRIRAVTTLVEASR